MLHENMMLAIGANEELVEELFNIQRYTGNAGTLQVNHSLALNNRGLVWVKNLASTPALLQYDTGRYFQIASGEYETNVGLLPSNTAVEASLPSILTADGYHKWTTTDNRINQNGTNYLSVAFKRSAKFHDVVYYIGDDTGTRVLPHALKTAPGFLYAKGLDTTTAWYARFGGISSEGFFNTNAVFSAAAGILDFDTTSVTVSSTLNALGKVYAVYLFAGLDSALKNTRQTSYAGNGSASGPVIDLGFEPDMLLIKRIDAAANWMLFQRANPGVYVTPHSATAPTTATNYVTFTSTGFSIGTTAAIINANLGIYNVFAIRRAS